MKYVIAAFALLSVVPFRAQALGPSFSYEGRAFDAGGNPLTAASVSFRVSIRPPGHDDCVMYSEVQTLNLSTTNGFFTLAINGASSTSQSYASASPTFEKVFSNASAFGLTTTDCVGGAVTYTPNASDGRNLKVEISTNNGSTYEELPLVAIGSVPYAINAQQVAGYGPSQLLRVGAGVTGTTELTQAMLTELNALLAGTSTKYATSSSSQGTAIASASFQPSSITAGSLWYDTTNSELKLYNGTTSVSLSTGGSGLTALTGDVTATGPGSAAATVASVGGVTAANVASGVNAAITATDANTSGTLVKRDMIGGFSAGTIAATSINASGPVAAGSVTVGSISMTGSSLNMSNIPITNVGRVLVGSLGSSTVPSFALPAAGLGIFQTSSSEMGFSSNSIERMRITQGGNVGIGTTSPASLFNVAQTTTDTTGFLSRDDYTVTPAATGSSYTAHSSMISTLSSSNPITNLYASANQVSHVAPSNITNAYGSYNLVGNNNASGTINAAYGSYSIVNAASGFTDNAYGVYSKVVGMPTNGYGVYIGSVAGSTNYGVYQSTASNKNYFAGDIGVGTLNPNIMVSTGRTMTVSSDDGTPGNLELARATPGTSGAAGHIRAFNGTNRIAGIILMPDSAANKGTIAFETASGGSPIEKMRITNAGNVGIGTTSPQATLDINGDIRLKKNTSEPVTCSATYDGRVALTSQYTLCVCNGSAWMKTSDGVTACSW